MRAPADRCPKCETETAVEPYREREFTESVVARYKCPCGWKWLVSWLRSALKEAA